MLDEDEPIGNGTLVGDELKQLSGRRGATKLGFALLLRFYAVYGRFPAGRSEIPDQAVAHVARLVDVPAAELGFYEWDGRTIKAHRADIRRYFGFRECSAADADKAAEWLAANVCEKERQADQVREELLVHLRGARIEPPARDRVRRIIGTALRQAGSRSEGTCDVRVYLVTAVLPTPRLDSAFPKGDGIHWAQFPASDGARGVHESQRWKSHS
jgi:hypothetical protein